MKRLPSDAAVQHHLPYTHQDVPIPITRFPPNSSDTSRRGNDHALRPRPTLKRTLTKRDRHVAPPPLVAPQSSRGGGRNGSTSNGNGGGHPSFSLAPGFHPSAPTRPSRSFWRLFVRILTFPIPSFLLSTCGNIPRGPPQQAWREKIALCLIALTMGGVVGFVTIGLNRTLCPRGVDADEEVVVQLGTRSGTIGISGWLFDASSSTSTSSSSTTISLSTLASQLPGQDVTSLFNRSASDYPSCAGLTGLFATSLVCSTNTTTTTTTTGLTCPLGEITSESTFSSLGITNTSLYVGYTWAQVLALENYMVLNGQVLNMSPYLSANPVANATDVVDTIIRRVLSAGNTTSATDAGTTNSTTGIINSIGTKDATRLIYNLQPGALAAQCLIERYVAGRIDKITPGCFVASLMLYALMIVILGIVFVRFAMALYFDWFLAKKLCRPPDKAVFGNSAGARGRVVPNMSLMPEGASVSKHDEVMGIAPWAGGRGNKLKRNGADVEARTNGNSNGNPARAIQPQIMSHQTIGAELFTFCLVTCYSEGEDSIRNTIESIANTTYSDNRKMLFVVCDGMVTGHGEKAPTPDICVSMLEPDPRFGDPTPMAYLSVGGAAKRENRAYVYAGHYVSRLSHRVPMLVVVKTGMPAEAKDSKPGNRGKRDSQMILMNWISRVTYNDRFTPLDYDLFRKTHVLMGVTPDWFEVVLMVDADTTIEQKSLTMLVNCMHHTNVMGVCGETHIQNKWASWVSMIQTMEYVIAHRLAKAFEAVFGGVTCLPGCFSMYRLKVPKGGGDDWIPILVDSSVIREYSQGEVHTLHTKNLLLLGEDRFLSTLMIRTFPGRDMSFCPQAECHTIVPSSFRVLLSQRRRWTSSTIHNLMELMRVRNLCGIFCFSMQFVVFCELVGTATLPVAMCLTYANIINIALSPPKTFEESIPLILLIAVLGLPSLLVIATTRDVRHVFWTMIYLVLGLPVFNFIIPVYALWQQDNFAWGETRRVEGNVHDADEVRPGKDETAKVLAGTTTPLRRWADWERSRLRKVRRQEKRRKVMEEREREWRMHGHDERLRPDGPGARHLMSSRDTDTYSIASSDEDVWGQDVGGYDEDGPPPLARPIDLDRIGGHVVDAAELGAMLETGWGEASPRGFDRRQRQGDGPSHPLSPVQPPQPIRTNGEGYPMRPIRQDAGRGYQNETNAGHDQRFVLGTAGEWDEGNPFGDDQQAMSTGVQPSPRTMGHAKKRSLAQKNGHGVAGGGGGYGPLL